MGVPADVVRVPKVIARSPTPASNQACRRFTREDLLTRRIISAVGRLRQITVRSEDDHGDNLDFGGRPPSARCPTLMAYVAVIVCGQPWVALNHGAANNFAATPARWAAFFAAHCAGTGTAIRAGNHGVSDPGARAGNGPARVRRGRSRHGCRCLCRCRESGRRCPQRR